jgi:hypothetical protein
LQNLGNTFTSFTKQKKMNKSTKASLATSIALCAALIAVTATGQALAQSLPDQTGLTAVDGANPGPANLYALTTPNTVFAPSTTAPAAVPGLADEKPSWNWKEHVWVNINGKSYHFQRNGYNERNWGLGAQVFTTDHSSWLFGHYDNSFGRPTEYVWYNYQPWQLGSTVQAGVIGGLVTGYQAHSRYVPSGIGGFSLTWKPFKKGNNDGPFLINLVGVPGVAVVGNIGFKFW